MYYLIHPLRPSVILLLSFIQVFPEKVLFVCVDDYVFSSNSLCSAVVRELRSYFLFLPANLVFVVRYTLHISEKPLCIIQAKLLTNVSVSKSVLYENH